MTVNSALPNWSLRLIAELDEADRRAQSVAKGLSDLQLNWAPRQGAWSVGQCLDHLRVANEVYLPAISAALEGRQFRKVDVVHLSRFSRWFIRNYIAPNPRVRARAPRKITPATQVASEVLNAFLRGNEDARKLVRRAGDYFVNRIRFRNQFIPLLRFTLARGLGSLT